MAHMCGIAAIGMSYIHMLAANWKKGKPKT